MSMEIKTVGQSNDIKPNYEDARRMLRNPTNRRASCCKCKGTQFHIKFEYKTAILAPICVNCNDFHGLEFLTDW